MTGKLICNLADYRGSKSTHSFFHADLAAANIDAHLGALGFYESYFTALGGIVRSANQHYQALAKAVIVSQLPSSHADCLIGNKWLVSYVDDVTGKGYQLEIPGADTVNGDLRAGDTDAAVLTEPEWAAWIAAFEGFAKSPAGNAVSVVGARIVLRNIKG